MEQPESLLWWHPLAILGFAIVGAFVWAWLAQKFGRPKCPLCRGSFECHTIECPLVQGWTLTEEEKKKLELLGYAFRAWHEVEGDQITVVLDDEGNPHVVH